jgi:hypothetical protein
MAQHEAARRPARRQVLLQGSHDPLADLLLQRESPRKRIHDARDGSDADQVFLRRERDGRLSTRLHEVMRTRRDHRDAPHDDELRLACEDVA